MTTQISEVDWPVVVVDDDPDVAFLLTQIFRRAGIHNRVMALLDAKEAFASLDELVSAAPVGQGSRPLFIMVDL